MKQRMFEVRVDASSTEAALDVVDLELEIPLFAEEIPFSIFFGD